eukprot:TRINITY_DN123773_c0_g1_i1.p1 TRINITY_DN123773_c0_g1~~TRINITY_DN123773_c0_g1_i1.p1  ORF type:complete len:546 (+),score=110.33 TRINITY_DN123773_c0_g1_i1:51-1688(+)
MAEPPEKRQKLSEAADEKALQSSASLHLSAKKSAGGSATTVQIELPKEATIADLAKKLALSEGCDVSQVTLICKGKVLSQAAESGSKPLAPVVEQENGALASIVYLVRKAAAAGPSAAAGGAAVANSGTQQPAKAASTASSVTAGSSSSSSSAKPVHPAAASVSKDGAGLGRRAILLIRHGQCCHNGERDEVKALTIPGQHQAEATAQYLAKLFAAGKLPSTRALVHSTSRRARETAKKIEKALPGIEVWNSDILRETDPARNPMRAEETFMNLFATPPAGTTDTLIVVAHNNMNLYLLMRAAGIPPERACQSWKLFSLRHASVTRIEVAASGEKSPLLFQGGELEVVSVGAAGHIPQPQVTWSNVEGVDLVQWNGGGPERRKMSGRMVIMVSKATSSPTPEAAMAEIASHVKGLTDFMISGERLGVYSTTAMQAVAEALSKACAGRKGVQVLPESIIEQPEAAFLQFFQPPVKERRDTIVLVSEAGPSLYWLMRALHLPPDQAQLAATTYRIGNLSLSYVNIKSDGSTNVVAVGDTGHLPIDCL